MISFQEIYDVLRKEKYNEQLQTLNKNFLSEVSSYILDKKKLVKKESNIFDETIVKTKKQLENVMAILKELIMLREKKILNLATIASRTGISKRDVENMLPHEKKFFIEITKKIEEMHKKFEEILEGREKKEFKKNVLIRFKRNVQPFLDLNGSIIGPFLKGDIANLRKEIAEILIKDNKAEIIKTE